MDRITDRPDMTSAVDRGRKALTKKKLNIFTSAVYEICFVPSVHLLVTNFTNYFISQP